MNYFGRFYSSPMYLMAPRVDVPIGQSCHHCQDTFMTEDDGIIDNDGAPFHRACWFRSLIGSLAHIERRCACFVKGSAESDPPGLTVRQAAEAALAALEYERRRAKDVN